MRVVSASKRMYLALKYPYGGIKSLSGRTKQEQDDFRSSPLSLLDSVDDYQVNCKGFMSVDEIKLLISSYLTKDDVDYHDILDHIIEGKPIKRSKLLKFKNLLKERIDSYV
jgi:hypothetical protein